MRGAVWSAGMEGGPPSGRRRPPRPRRPRADGQATEACTRLPQAAVHGEGPRDVPIASGTQELRQTENQRAICAGVTVVPRNNPPRLRRLVPRLEDHTDRRRELPERLLVARVEGLSAALAEQHHHGEWPLCPVEHRDAEEADRGAEALGDGGHLAEVLV